MSSASTGAPLDNGPALRGAIEAGGTKIQMAVGTGPRHVGDRRVIDTTTPEAAVEAIEAFFKPYSRDLRSIGVASFGPIRIDPEAADWGTLLRTPKRGWAGANLVRQLTARYKVPIEVDTDVNAAAMAEHRIGALQGVRSGVYILAGEGVGAGLIEGGRPIHGNSHPEFGHIRVRRPKHDDSFPGCCPFHGDCLEGLAFASAIRTRWGASLDVLPDTHAAHSLVAHYLGEACATLALTVSTGRIVIGGDISNSRGLHDRVAHQMRQTLGNYLLDEAVLRPDYVVPPALKEDAGIVGALLLAIHSEVSSRRVSGGNASPAPPKRC